MGLDCDGQNIGAVLGTFPSITDFTLTAWINMRTVDGTTRYSIIDLASRSSPFAGPNLLIDQSDGGVGTYNGGYIFSSVYEVTFGTWAFVGIRVFIDATNGTIEVWMDEGSSGWDTISTGDTTGIVINADDHMIGRWAGDTDSNPAQSARGVIADARLYNRLMSASEMQTIYSARGDDGIVEGLTGRWRLAGGAVQNVALAGSWVNGLSRGVTDSGLNRLLVFFAAHKDASTNTNLSTVTYGGQTLTFIQRVELVEAETNHIEMWMLDEAGIAASSGTTFSVTWSPVTSPSLPLYTSGFYTNGEQTAFVGVQETKTETASGTIETAGLLTGSGELVIAAASASASNAYTTGNNFTIEGNATNGAHRLTSIDASGASLHVPTLTMSPTPTRHVMVAAVMRAVAPPATHRSLFVSKSAEAATSTTSITLNTVSDVIDGDVLVACICPSGDNSTVPANVTTPAGWTLVANGDLPFFFSTASLWIFRRTASSEPASYVFATNQTNSIIGIMVNLRGAAESPDVVSALDTGTSDAPLCPSVTAGGDAICLRILAVGSERIPNQKYDVSPAGINCREALELPGAEDGCSLAFGDEMVSAGSTGTREWNPTSSGRWGCYTITWLGGFGAETSGVRDLSGNGVEGSFLGDPKMVEDVLRT